MLAKGAAPSEVEPTLKRRQYGNRQHVKLLTFAQRAA